MKLQEFLEKDSKWIYCPFCDEGLFLYEGLDEDKGKDIVERCPECTTGFLIKKNGDIIKVD